MDTGGTQNCARGSMCVCVWCGVVWCGVVCCVTHSQASRKAFFTVLEACLCAWCAACVCVRGRKQVGPMSSLMSWGGKWVGSGMGEGWMWGREFRVRIRGWVGDQ
jgi:hypothetical protein